MGQVERGVLDVLKMRRAAVHHPSAEQLPDEEQAGRRVLVVDQDENALIALKQLLGADYDTTTARSRLKALPVLWQGTFDVVLLADKLDMSGEEVVQQVRIRRTGYAGRSDAERAAF